MMKKITAIVLLFCFTASFSSVYDFDATDFSNDFEALDEVESSYFEHKKSNTVEDYLLEFNESPIVSADPFSAGQLNEFYFDVEGFAWGFCCCPIGFFVVAINDNKDEDQKKSYWIGVIASAALSAISTVAGALSTI